MDGDRRIELVGRAAERTLIDESLGKIANPKELLRTPLVVFEGPTGSDKTFLLDYLGFACGIRYPAIPCIRIQYGTEPFMGSVESFTQTLLPWLAGPLALAVELDGLNDETGDTLADGLEALYRTPGQYNLFTAMASREERDIPGYVVGKVLTHIPLKPLTPFEARELLQKRA